MAERREHCPEFRSLRGGRPEFFPAGVNKMAQRGDGGLPVHGHGEPGDFAVELGDLAVQLGAEVGGLLFVPGWRISTVQCCHDREVTATQSDAQQMFIVRLRSSSIVTRLSLLLRSRVPAGKAVPDGDQHVDQFPPLDGGVAQLGLNPGDLPGPVCGRVFREFCPESGRGLVKPSDAATDLVAEFIFLRAVARVRGSHGLLACRSCVMVWRTGESYRRLVNGGRMGVDGRASDMRLLVIGRRRRQSAETIGRAGILGSASKVRFWR